MGLAVGSGGGQAVGRQAVEGAVEETRKGQVVGVRPCGGGEGSLLPAACPHSLRPPIPFSHPLPSPSMPLLPPQP